MKNLIIYILFFLVTIPLVAQKDSLVVQFDKSTVQLKKFDASNLENYRSKSDFDYTEHKQSITILGRVWNWLKRMLKKFFTWLFGAKKAIGIVASIFRVLPYVILALALFFLVKFFLKVDMNTLIRGKTERSKVTITEDEDIIKNKDISQLIAQAVANNNYRLAVRYYYLLTLQKLEEKELINWEQQKTNEDYIKEIQSKKINVKFKEVTYLYDFIWYGNFDINHLEFSKIETNFNELTKSIV